ncbi:hypothetical protein LCGC14_1344960 [marine sediment metagenome]|uniref:Uncharacterized protein n=1 Tax=marine sediment metagenome TaxID=412755 RepID=A0A0F9KYW0_9ZZZZ
MNSPKINYEMFKGMNREEILKVFIHQIPSKRTWKSHLKIYIIRSYEFSPNDITDFLKNSYFKKPDKTLKKFMEAFIINIYSINSNIFHLKMEHIRSKKKFHFIIFDDNKYWIVITLVEKKDVGNTLESIIKKIPSLRILEITNRHLEDLISDQNFEKDIIGFIARYQPYKSTPKRKITIDVYGGDLEDLSNIRDIFFVEPKTFKYSLTNSPSSVIEGKIFNEGYFTMKYVEERNELFAIKTISRLTKSFEEIDKLYEDSVKYKNSPTILKKGYGFLVNSIYSIVINIKKNRIKGHNESMNKRDQTTFEIINNKIIEYFSNRPRYQIYSEDTFSHFICDKETRSKVQITIEPRRYNIILYPFKNCSDMCLRDICNGINEVEHSFNAIKPFIIN